MARITKYLLVLQSCLTIKGNIGIYLVQRVTADPARKDEIEGSVFHDVMRSANEG